MDVKYINPFIESIQEMFTRMLGSRATRGEVAVSRNGVGKHEITALIGLGGPVQGMVALSFPAETAMRISSHLLGRPINGLDESVSDAVAECVNIVAGNAKAKLGTGDRIIDLSLPTVVRGESYGLHYPSGSLWLEIPFQSDLGPFHFSVTLAKKDRKAESKP